MTVTSNGASNNVDKTPDGTIISALPEGDNQFRLPDRIEVEGAQRYTIPPGYSAEGLVTAGGDAAQYTVYLSRGGSIIRQQSYPFEFYTAAEIGAGIVGGEDVTGERFPSAIVALESGGQREVLLDSRGARQDVAFDLLTVNVDDVNGEAAEGELVTVGSQSGETVDGTFAVTTAGTVTVSALGGAISEDIDVNTTDSATYQYAGVEGTARTPGGDSYVGETVTLYTRSGNVVAKTTTTEDGAYKLPRVPPGRDYYVEVGGFFRKYSSGSQGSLSTINFPATLLLTGSFDDPTEVSDSDIQGLSFDVLDNGADEPIRGAVAQSGDARSVTSALGRATLTILSSSAAGEQTATIEVSAGDRYNSRELEVDRSDPDIGTVRLTKRVASGTR
jgi:hypothetical protein